MVIRILCFVCLSLQVFSQNFDIDFLKKVNVGRNKNLDPGFQFLSGSSDYLAIGTPVTLLTVGFVKNDSELKKQGLNAAITTFGTYAAAYVFKESIKRYRPYLSYPYIENYRNEKGYSFPSGSTSLAFSTATTLSLSYPKWYVIVPSYLYAGSVGYARMHLGAHYPSDVAAGALLGAASAVVTKQLNKLITNKYRKRQLKKSTWEE
jgi:membrane-associated phospholipid phosphatase